MTNDRRAGQVTTGQWRDAANGLRELAAEWDAKADAADAWTVPPEHRPSCPLNGKPCTSWTCLVDVCARAEVAGG